MAGKVDTLAVIDHGKKIGGKPRLNWYQVTLQDLWQEVRRDHPDPSVRFAAGLDIKKTTHVEAVKTCRGINRKDSRQN